MLYVCMETVIFIPSRITPLKLTQFISHLDIRNGLYVVFWNLMIFLGIFDLEKVRFFLAAIPEVATGKKCCEVWKSLRAKSVASYVLSSSSLEPTVSESAPWKLEWRCESPLCSHFFSCSISRRPQLFLNLADLFWRESWPKLPLPYGIHGSGTLHLHVPLISRHSFEYYDQGTFMFHTNNCVIYVFVFVRFLCSLTFLF